MGNVVDLAAFRRKKVNEQILSDLTNLTFAPQGPSDPWVSEARFREIFGDPNPSIVRINKGYRKFVPKEPTLPKVDYSWNPMEVMSATDMKLRIIENRAKMYEIASVAPKMDEETFKRRWPVFVALLDEYEHRANALVEQHWAIKGGCRPGVALAIREEKKAVGALLRRCNNYWFEES